jgi:hypothetical protein
MILQCRIYTHIVQYRTQGHPCRIQHQNFKGHNRGHRTCKQSRGSRRARCGLQNSNSGMYNFVEIFNLTIVHNIYSCAADFALLNLPKGKSLGRSKPATSSYAQALQHTVWDDSYYILLKVMSCLYASKHIVLLIVTVFFGKYRLKKTISKLC